ncbi:hypothetical protein ABPG72_019513 [Tetrahymena utriculariae]
MSDSKGNNPGNDYEEIVISDRRSITSDEEDSDYQEHDLQNQQEYELVSHYQSNMQFCDENKDIRINQLSNQQVEVCNVGDNVIQQKIELEHVKQRLSQFDIRDGNNTPNSPSYLVFAPDQLKLNQNHGNEKVEKHLLKSLEEFSPISRMEDSRGDMTVQIFDFSMVQGRDQHLGSNFNNQGSCSSRNGKSTFSNLANSHKNKDQNKNGIQAFYTSFQTSNAPLPPTLSRLSNNSKQEQKAQKLRERLEKYSHQMMNNVNLQKTSNDAATLQKQNIKNSIVQQKNSTNNLTLNKKGSIKSSKISTPIAKKSTLNNNEGKQFEAQVEQRREKLSNSYQKPTLSSTQKQENSKTEKSTPNNANKQNQASSSIKQKYNLQQSIQQHQQISMQIQKKISQPSNQADKNVQKKQQNIVQAKFLLTSPQKNKIQQNNFLANLPSQGQSQPNISDSKNANFRETPYQRYSNIIGSNQQSKQKSQSPSDIARTVGDIQKQNLSKNYMSDKNNQRKYSENINNNSLKKSYSQENINQQRKDSYSSHQSANVKQIPNDKNDINRDSKLDLICLRQLYRDSLDNYSVKQNIDQNQKQEQTNNLQKEEEGDEFEINIYKNQSDKFSAQKNKKVLDDEDEQLEFPQLYHINRSQSQHDQNYILNENNNIDEDGKNNSQNLIRRSYTQDNILNHFSAQNSSQKVNDQSLYNQTQPKSFSNKEYAQNSSKDNIQYTKEFIENSFNQSNSNYFKLTHFQESKNNPKNTPFHNNNINQQLTGDSNFTSYTNALSVVTNQGQKVISSAKYIDQDEDEIIDNNEQQFISQREAQSKNKDHQQQIDLKSYNIPPKQRKAITNYNPRESPNRQNQVSPKIQKQISQNNNNNSNNNSNSNHIDLRKNNNYFHPLNNEKPVSQRYSDQIDIRKKSEATNKTNTNYSNSSLNLNNPICLYNLQKENSNKNVKNINNNYSNNVQNQNYYSLKEGQNQSGSRKQNSKQQSPFPEDSPVKLVNKNQILNDLKRQAQNQEKQIIDINQKSKRAGNTQSIHSIDKGNQNSYSQQTQRSHPVLPNDSQIVSQSQISTQNQYYLKNAASQNQSTHNINSNTPIDSNSNTKQQFYSQNSQYQQLFQQKQAGKIYSQRDAAKKKQKFIRNSNDYKNQQQSHGDQQSMNYDLSENIMNKLYPDQKKNVSKSKELQKQNSKTQNSIYDTNIDYILKLLKESSTIQQQNSMILQKNNQNASFCQLNNKYSTSQQQKTTQQQQQQQKISSKSPTQTSASLVRQQFSKYLQIVQKKTQKSPFAQQGVASAQKDLIAQRIQQIEQEIPKIKQQKNQIALENNILEQQNQLLKQNLQNI